MMFRASLCTAIFLLLAISSKQLSLNESSKSSIKIVNVTDLDIHIPYTVNGLCL